MQESKNRERLYFLFAPYLIWTVIAGALLMWSLERERSSVAAIALHQAKAFVDLTVTTRTWNAEHGGIYIPVTEKTKPSPYLEAADREVVTTDGLRLAKINPAYMTRQISDLSAGRKMVRIHITSLEPTQPANVPDSWEAQALRSIDAGEKERLELIDSSNGETLFRFISPLFAEQSCLHCHEKQKLKEGSLMGGISVSIPASTLMASGKSHMAELGGVYFFLWLLGIGAMAGGARYLRERKRVEERLKAVSLTDELTGLNNRRGFFLLAEQAMKGAARNRMSASLFYLDLDSMKWINDNLGHEEGDLALRDTALILKRTFRDSDILGRLGGDEFVVLASETSPLSTPEPLRDRLKKELDNHNLHAHRRYELLISMGCAHFDPDSSVSVEELLKTADALMYEEKMKKKASSSLPGQRK